MKKLIALLGLLAFACGLCGAQALTTLTGTIKDLSGSTVTYGRIQFTSTLTGTQDATIPGIARFVPTTTYCGISPTGQVVNYVNGSPGTGACTITSNTALQPSGTSYKVCVQPNNVAPGGCFNFFALAGQTVDISTIAPTPTQLPINYQGAAGPPGCVIGGIGTTGCTASLTPQSVSGVLDATTFGGSGLDICQRLALAWASVAGTAANPNPAAFVKLPPNQNYTAATTCEMPHDSSFPFISRPMLDMQGSSINFPSMGASPAFVWRGENALTSANGTGFLINGTLSRPDGSGPLMQVNDRLGLMMSNVALYGGSDNYLVLLGTYDGGPGYQEQTSLTNMAFINPANAGIHVKNFTGGNGGYQYNYGYRLRFQFDNNGTFAQVQADGVGIWNNHYDTTVNTGGTGKLYLLNAINGGSFMSTHIEANGEPTDNLKSFAMGGGGLVDVMGRNLTRSSITMEPNANWSSDRVTVLSSVVGEVGGLHTSTQESSYENGARGVHTLDWGEGHVRFHAITDGVEQHGYDQILGCVTSATTPLAYNSTNCTNAMYQIGTGGFGFGPGFHDSKTNTEVPAYTVHVHGDVGITPFPNTLTARGAQAFRMFYDTNGDFVIRAASPPVTAGQPESAWTRLDFYWGGTSTYANALKYRGHGDGTADGFWNGTLDATKFSSGGTAGFTGTCASTTTLTVVGGIITGCS